MGFTRTNPSFTLLFFMFILSIVYRGVRNIIKALRPKTVPLLAPADPKNDAQVDTTPLHNPNLLYQEFEPGTLGNMAPYGSHYYGV
jgi:hypothetical protein